jgi:hypothetical protein
MTRFVNSAAQTAADQPHVLYAALVKLSFVSQTVCFFNGAGTLTFNGLTYLGLGQYGSIQQVGESTDLKPSNPLLLTISGLPDAVTPALAATCANRADYYGQSARIDIALFDNLRNILTPIENAVWEGRMDSMTMQRATNTIQLSCEDRMILFDKANDYLNTQEFQGITYPGDTFFDQVPFMVNQQITWGGVPVGGTIQPYTSVKPGRPGGGRGGHR